MDANIETRENRWWLPEEWLPLVFGVWMNQVWYWQYIRPRLDRKEEGQTYLLSALLGSLVVIVSLNLLTAGFYRLAGYSLHPGSWLWGSGICLALVFLAGLAAYHSSLRAWSLPLLVVAGISAGALVALIAPLFAALEDTEPALFLLDGLIGAGSGIGLGITYGVALGNAPSRNENLMYAFGIAICAALLGWLAPVEGADWVRAGLEAILGGTSFGLGLFVGGWWATRQIPQRIVRIRLARHDTN